MFRGWQSRIKQLAELESRGYNLKALIARVELMGNIRPEQLRLGAIMTVVIGFMVDLT